MFLQYCKKILLTAAVSSLLLSGSTGSAQLNQTIMFIPHDNRPISFKQTADNIRDLGYEVLTPPAELLGDRQNPQGHPDELAQWARDNAKKADAAVLSADSLVYGSLVASRKHDIPQDKAVERARNFSRIHEANPNMKLYVFASIMRTPQTGAASGSEDADYYAKYGTDIARYTALLDKAQQADPVMGQDYPYAQPAEIKSAKGLSRKDKKQLEAYRQNIPQAALDDWYKRRNVNFMVNHELIDLAAEGDISFLALGCDDNAKYSQTNMERRALDRYGSSLTEQKYQSVAGIDEIAYVLLTRAVNNIEGDIPFVSVHYADGMGADTIPAYSNEPIKKSIAAHIKMAGGMQIPNDKRADLVFMVNTRYDGTTGAANEADNVFSPNQLNENIASFTAMVENAVDEGKKVGIGDITFGNGSDNSLMFNLYRHQLLDKLSSYSGWNTPTNSTGYALAMGMGANYTDRIGILKMLEVRYLDDWLYQANIRQHIANLLPTLPGEGDYSDTKTRTKEAESLATKDLQKMIADYSLADFEGQSYVKDAQLRFPWQRMFEADIVFPQKDDEVHNTEKANKEIYSIANSKHY